MKCLIIAAGSGSRLAALGDSKPLVSLLGLPIIERVLLAAKRGGIKDFYVVTGYNGEKVRAFLEVLAPRRNLSITPVVNEQWNQAGNGMSVLKAREHLQEPFILLMADHLFDADIVARLQQVSLGKNQVCLAIDRNLSNPLVDGDDVTKVRVDQEQIRAIGKHLEDYNAYDTGLFLCHPTLFEGLEKSMTEHKDSSLAGGIRILAQQRKAGTMEVGDSFWLDVDNEQMLNRGECHLLGHLKKNRDGPVSKHLNRPVSVRITRFLVKRTNVTPNQISLISFLVCVAASGLFAMQGYWSLVLGGVLAQFASILDGCDGEIARLKLIESDFGGWFDAVLDRYADALMLFGLTWHVYTNSSNEIALGVGFLAIIGSFMTSYTADKYDSLMRVKFEQGKGLRMGRDIRVFMIFVGTLLNVPLLVLWLVAVVMNLETLRRVVVAHSHE